MGKGLSDPLTKSLAKTNTKWPRAGKTWELLSQRTSWNSSFFRVLPGLVTDQGVKQRHVKWLLQKYYLKTANSNSNWKTIPLTTHDYHLLLALLVYQTGPLQTKQLWVRCLQLRRAVMRHGFFCLTARCPHVWVRLFEYWNWCVHKWPPARKKRSWQIRY